MEFGAFLGNESLKQRLSAAIKQQKLTHSFLLAGPEGSGKRTLAKLLCAAMQCTAEEKPCLRCAQCRKVLGGIHPDIIVVDDPEKKTVPVGIVRDARSTLFIRPNEGRKKIYLFPRAQDLNAQGQNALLKCMEEPPEYGVFLLLTETTGQLLPTVRSRCVELQLSPLRDAVLLAALRECFPDASEPTLQAAAACSEGYLGKAIRVMQQQVSLLPQSVAFIQAYCEQSNGGLLRVLTPMERLKRDQLRAILVQWRELLADALTSRRGASPSRPESARIASSRSAASLLAGIDALDQAIQMIDANVGSAHICGALTVLLR